MYKQNGYYNTDPLAQLLQIPPPHDLVDLTELCVSDNVGVQDMTTLSNLTVEGINCNLRDRYKSDLIYTYTGTILIAVNPYKELNIYGTPQIALYHNSNKKSNNPPPPHIYAIAEQAYNNLIRNYDEVNDVTENQSIVISGESGAGKTETTKFILQYLCHVTSNVNSWVENQILEANTILEAFGNAKTIRNDNSSRFGKFMRLSFDSKWMIRGCIIQDYLLEQSRITFQCDAERNYHVFYQLVTAARSDPELSRTYCLEQHETHKRVAFKYLKNQHETVMELDPLLLALQILQIPSDHVVGLFSVISSILWLGNLEFGVGGDGETAVLAEVDRVVVDNFCRLVCVDKDEFVSVLLSRQINVRGNITEIPLRVNEASENRHAMSKALYSKAFRWLIRHINERTNPGQECRLVIGLLDIFGFENFGVNSFEQICINYANEKLHKFFNQAVFSIEQEIYKSEGLNITHIKYTDNASVLELLEKPPRCILKLLTEQCHLPKGSDLGFLNNLHTEFESHECYEKGERRNWDNSFTILHYAGKVTYNVVGFVDKNRDTQQDLFFNLLGGSGNEFVVNLVNCGFECGGSSSTMARGTSKGRPTVAETFRGQLCTLVEVLSGTKASYVRCIKPNESKVEDFYDEGLVVEQLNYLGMLEIIRIRREGYSVHLRFEEFVGRYWVVVKKRGRGGGFKDVCSQILTHITPNLPPPPATYNPHTAKSTTYLKQSAPNYFYQLGTTKVFLKPQAYELLESTRHRILTTHVIKIQTAYKRHMALKNYKTLRHATVTIQRAYSTWKLRLAFIRKRRAAIKIQAGIRGFFAREVALALREMRRVEEELRKREVLEMHRRSVCEGMMSGSSGDEMSIENVVGGDKDVSLDNLFEFLLIGGSGGSGDNNNGQGGNRASELPTEQSNSNNIEQFDKISTQINKIVSDLDNIQQQDDTNHNRNSGSDNEQVAMMTTSNSICSSMSNFEIDGEEEFDGEDEDSEVIRTPVNASPPPLVAPPENIPVVATKVVVSRLPEPKVPPPPPPIEFSNGSGGNSTSGATGGTQQVGGSQKIVKKKSGNGGDEPIYESIQPRTVCEVRKVEVVAKKPEFLPITNPILSPPPPVPQPLPSQPSYSARVEKRVQEIKGVGAATHNTQIQSEHQSRSNATSTTEDEITTFHQYALQYFSLENRKSNQTQEEYVAEHTQFTKNYHINHPHVHLYDPSNIQVACYLFRDLNKFMRGEVKNETEVLQTIIGYGIEREELRDEIYVQVLRQICGNGNVEWLERLYLVFCLGVVSFSPGKVLGRVISYELGGICNGDRKVNGQIKWVLDNLQDLKGRGFGVRSLPPSNVEIQAMKRLGTIVCRFFFLDGRTKAIDIHPTDTAYDAVVKLGEKIGVGGGGLVEGGWAIYQVRPSERVEEHVASHVFIYDVIAGWEVSGGGGGCGDNRFVFKKRLFKGNCREIPQDPVEASLLYAQAVFSVVKRDDFPVAEKVSLQLAGLQAQVLFSDPPQPNNGKPPPLDNYTNIDSFLPIRISRTRPHNTWPPILAQAHRTYGQGKSELVARVWYLSCVMQYPTYGTTMFHVVYRGYWVYGNSLVLGVSSDGLSMIKNDDKFVMYEYAYNQIESIQVESAEKLITINLNRALPPDTHKCFVFESNSVGEIAGLIGSYCPSLGQGKVNNNTPAGVNNNQPVTKQPNQLTNQDRMRLYSTLLTARKNLIDSGLLRKPDKQMVGVKLFKNTLRRLSKHKVERMRQYEHAIMMGNSNDSEDNNNAFPIEWFCYTKHSITSSLTSLPQELEGTAVWIFSQLQNFANLNTSNNSSGSSGSANSSPMKTSSNNTVVLETETHGASILQGVFEKVWRSDGLINELYMQLIRQTTDHPEPNSRVNSRYWGVISLVCSVIAPPDSCVRKYLNSHLKRCALTDFVTEEGKYARFAEKCLQHTISSSSLSPQSRRQWPPSKNEIMCTVNRKPITCRFYFMDGKYHTLQFAPNDTAADLISSLTSKIGLPDGVKGYAIYEVSTSTPPPPTPQQQQQSTTPTPWERSLTPTEKPVEVIARWERQKPTSGNPTQQLFKFIIRKHLYDSLDLSNPIEKELVYHQLLSSARNDRFPVSDTEAAMLVALQAQVELGDYSSSGGAGEFPDYCHVSSHCLPTRIAALVSHEAVARHHQSLVGSSSGQAKQAVLNLLMSWPLFKCIVFDVTQSFTSNWPRSLWLALDNTGLHLLPQRTRHTLCTFEYRSIKSYSPSPTCFMVITRENCSNGNNNNKVVLSTNQAYQIAQLIKEFVYSNFVAVQQQTQAQGRSNGN